ncbi:uL15 family ribosomal protein, partial [bacterium]|nr:uL15 family ribosomal protein [bacterium]
NKTSKYLVSTIREAAKNPAWVEVAGILSGPKRTRVNVNISELNDVKNIIICGKVLSEGDIKDKKKVVALGFSEGAKEKLLNAGCEVVTIIDEIKKNPEFKNLEVFKK